MKLKRYGSRLYVRGHTRALALGEKLGTLRGNVTLVLNVAPMIDAELAEAAGEGPFPFRYLHVPLADGVKVSPVVPALADIVVEEIERGGAVLVHCNGGRNRSVLVAVLAEAYLTQRPAVAVLEALRGVYPTALANPVFEAYVMEASRA